MNVTSEAILAVIGAGATMATAIFYGAFYLGDYRRRLMSLEDGFQKHVSDFTVHIDRRYHHEQHDRS